MKTETAETSLAALIERQKQAQAALTEARELQAQLVPEVTNLIKTVHFKDKAGVDNLRDKRILLEMCPGKIEQAQEELARIEEDAKELFREECERLNVLYGRIREKLLAVISKAVLPFEGHTSAAESYAKSSPPWKRFETVGDHYRRGGFKVDDKGFIVALQEAGKAHELFESFLAEISKPTPKSFFICPKK